MRRNTAMPIIISAFSAAALLLFSTPALAHLCLLKSGEWSLSTASVCYAADTASAPADDGIIEVDFYVTDSELEFDVVYGQATPTAQKISGFTNRLEYDPRMGNPDNCNCHDKRASYTPPIPNPPCEQCDIYEYPVCCTTYPVIQTDPYDEFKWGDFLSDYIRSSYPKYYVYTANASDIFYTTTNNLWMSVLTFENIYTTETDNAFTFEFNLTHISPTEIIDEDACDVLTESCSGNIRQVAMKTRVNIIFKPCFIGKPAISNLTCLGRPGCTETTGDADTALAFTVPSKCWQGTPGSWTEYPCAEKKVLFTNLSGQAVELDQSGSPYQETSTVGDIISYSLYGTSDECYDSYPSPDPSSGKFGNVTTNSVLCKCGDPPECDQPVTGCNYYQNIKIDLEYSFSDPDAAGPEDIDNITFYYTNDPEAAEFQSADLTGLLDQDWKVTATIPANYVVADETIYFGITVADSDGLTGRCPALFDPTSVSSIADTGTTIDGSCIKEPSAPGFYPGLEPYPNMFPFMPGDGNVLKVFFKMTDTADVEARVYSLDGTLVRYLPPSSKSFDTCIPGAPRTCNFCNYAEGCIWDGTGEDNGSLIANGMYIFSIRAFFTGSLYPGSSLEYTKGIVIMK